VAAAAAAAGEAASTLESAFAGEPAAAGQAPEASDPAGEVSFDEFFGATPAPQRETAPVAPVAPVAPAPEARPDDGAAADLAAFNAWLEGLKQ
jgi:hypothetical protein